MAKKSKGKLDSISKEVGRLVEQLARAEAQLLDSQAAHDEADRHLAECQQAYGSCANTAGQDEEGMEFEDLDEESTKKAIAELEAKAAQHKARLEEVAAKRRKLGKSISEGLQPPPGAGPVRGAAGAEADKEQHQG